jgi:hypothetical protein
MEFMARMVDAGLDPVTCRSCAYDPMVLAMAPEYILFNVCPISVTYKPR